MSLFRRRTAGSASLPIEGHLPGFEGATSWLNARPLGEADLRGKADWDTLESPETYLGYEQARNFASAADAALDRRRTYVAPASLTRNEWALRGDWTIARGASILDCADGRIVFRIHARDVNLVMAPRGSVAPRCPSGCSSTAKHHPTRTESTSTTRAAERSRSSASTS
jgi:hypothetical protein